MQKIIIVLVVGAALIASCSNNEKQFNKDGVPYPAVSLSSFEDRISYALGADAGANFNNVPDDVMVLFDKEALEKGFHTGILKDDEEKKTCRDLLETVFAAPNNIDTSLHDMSVVSDCYGYIFGEMLRKNLKGRNAYEMIDADMSSKGFAHALYQADTLIPLDERGEMIINFNNDMNRKSGEHFMEQARNFTNALTDDRGWVIVEKKKGTGEQIDPEKEYRMVFSLMKSSGDTIISTVMDENLSPDENAQVINTDDIILPNGWVYVSPKMNVGGVYDIYFPHDLAFGEKGLMDKEGSSYIVQPFTSVKISVNILEQAELHSFAKKKGEKVLAEAKKKPNTRVGKSGYVLEVIEEGEGQKVPAGSDVKAHYILTNANGDIVENSYSGAQQGRGTPSFSLNSVVKGWQDAVPEMRKGGRYKLYLPYDLAYGENGNQAIAPYETLVFEMEILDFGKPGALTGK